MHSVQKGHRIPRVAAVLWITPPPQRLWWVLAELEVRTIARRIVRVVVCQIHASPHIQAGLEGKVDDRHVSRPQTQRLGCDVT
eukprot:5973429-Prymnesium_polylepis.1